MEKTNFKALNAAIRAYGRTPPTAQTRDLMLANARKAWSDAKKRLSERVVALRARLAGLRFGLALVVAIVQRVQ